MYLQFIFLLLTGAMFIDLRFIEVHLQIVLRTIVWIFLLGNEKDVINDPNSLPTFDNWSGGTCWIDVTAAGYKIVDKVSDWKIPDNDSLSPVFTFEWTTSLRKEIKRLIFVTFIFANGEKNLQIPCNITFMIARFRKKIEDITFCRWPKYIIP